MHLAYSQQAVAKAAAAVAASTQTEVNSQLPKTTRLAADSQHPTASRMLRNAFFRFARWVRYTTHGFAIVFEFFVNQVS